MNIIIDANILLSLYEVKGDDYSDLKAIIDLSDSGKFGLLSTSMIVEEYVRNRERVISESVANFNKFKLNLSYPSIVRNLIGYGELKKQEKEFKEAHEKLRKNMHEKVSSDDLEADSFIQIYLEKSTKFKYDIQIIEEAKVRDALGQDPGKSGQIGDHINWLLLLESASEDDLMIISRDGDYECSLDRGQIKRSLKSEFEQVNGKQVYLATSLNDVVKKHKDIVELHERKERQEAIEKLENSSSFASTHSSIYKLQKYRFFREEEVQKIIKIYKNNHQINYIFSDEDVKEFFESLRLHITNDSVYTEYEEAYRDFPE